MFMPYTYCDRLSSLSNSQIDLHVQITNRLNMLRILWNSFWQSCRAHFTKGTWAHNPNIVKVSVVLKWKLMMSWTVVTAAKSFHDWTQEFTNCLYNRYRKCNTSTVLVAINHFLSRWFCYIIQCLLTQIGYSLTMMALRLCRAATGRDEFAGWHYAIFKAVW